MVGEAIRQRLPLGYGYGVFWGDDGPAASLVYPGIDNHWEPESAHNGFLEVALNIGLVGEIALFVLLVVGIRRAFLVLWRRRDGISAWPLCAILCVITLNLSEATFAAYNLVDWIVFVSAFLLATEAEKETAEVRTETRRVGLRLAKPKFLRRA